MNQQRNRMMTRNLFQYEENKKLKIFVNDKGYCIDGAIEPKEINYKLLNKDEKTELEKCFWVKIIMKSWKIWRIKKFKKLWSELVKNII